MAGLDISKKIKKGMAKANVKLGNGTSLVYLNQKSYTPGGTPSNPAVETITPTVLVDAIVSSYDLNLIGSSAQGDGTDLIRAGDKMLVSNGDIEISQSDEIDINGVIHIVISVDVKTPSNVPLAYISQVRRQ